MNNRKTHEIKLIKMEDKTILETESDNVKTEKLSDIKTEKYQKLEIIRKVNALNIKDFQLIRHMTMDDDLETMKKEYEICLQSYKVNCFLLFRDYFKDVCIINNIEILQYEESLDYNSSKEETNRIFEEITQIQKYELKLDLLVTMIKENFIKKDKLAGSGFDFICNFLYGSILMISAFNNDNLVRSKEYNKELFLSAVVKYELYNVYAAEFILQTIKQIG